MCGIGGFFGKGTGAAKWRCDAGGARRARAGCRVVLDPRLRPRISRRSEMAAGGTPCCMPACRSSTCAPKPTSRWPTTLATSGSATTARSMAGRLTPRELKARGAVFRTRSDTEYHPACLRGLGHGHAAPACAACSPSPSSTCASASCISSATAWARNPCSTAPDGELAFGFDLARACCPGCRLRRRALSPAGIDAYLAHRYIPAPHTVLEQRTPPAARPSLGGATCRTQR